MRFNNEPRGYENHIDSHYAAHLHDKTDFGALQAKVSTQTCVIGGGFAGLTTARELARKGHDVVLLEAQLVGWGASGRNGGFVSSGFARSAQSIASKIGWANTKKLFKLSERGRDYMADTIVKLAPHKDDAKKADISKVKLGEGWLKLLRHNNVDALLQYRDMMEGQFGVDLEYVAKNNLDRFVKSERYFAGLHDKESFHIQPLQYAYQLANDIKKHAGRIFERSRCEFIERNEQSTIDQKPVWAIGTANGLVFADNIVLATSSYGGPLARMNSAILPIATYVVSSSPSHLLLDDLIPFRGCIADTRRSGDYYRTIGEGDERRLIWGGRITTMRRQPERLKQMLKADITNAYPQLANLKIERSWSGLMGYARHQMPIIAQPEDGLWVASAFGGQGLNTCAMAGLLVSEAILDGSDEYRLFEPFGMVSAGGILGRLAVQLEYWRLQYLDASDERSSQR